MKYRKLTITRYQDVAKHCPEFVYYGVNNAVLSAYKTIFLDDKVLQAEQIKFTPVQQGELRRLIKTMCNLIRKTQIIEGAKPGRTQLANTTIMGLPQMLGIVLRSALDNREKELKAESAKLKKGHASRRTTKIDKLRKKDEKLFKMAKLNISLPKNDPRYTRLQEIRSYVEPGAPQEILTLRREWFINKYRATPEVMYIAAIFYIIDYMYAYHIRNRDDCGAYGATILKLMDLANGNAAKKRAAERSAFERR